MQWTMLDIVQSAPCGFAQHLPFRRAPHLPSGYWTLERTATPLSLLSISITTMLAERSDQFALLPPFNFLLIDLLVAKFYSMLSKLSQLVGFSIFFSLKC